MSRPMQILLKLVLCTMLAWSAVYAQEVKRDITPVTDDVYRFQNNRHVNMFVITGDGVVVTDPINAEAAIWLKQQIADITDQPITTLIFSHSHGDHASGGDEYGDIATIIAHENAPDFIDLVEPSIRFSERLNFTQGDKVFELSYLGPGHGNDLIAMVVRPDNVAFVVDAVSARRLFFRNFPGANVDNWIAQVKHVDALDFEHFIGGHGPIGTKQDVAEAINYLEEMRAAVLEGLKAGQSLEDLKASIKMQKYQSWASYDTWLGLNIEGMARHLRESGALQ